MAQATGVPKDGVWTIRAMLAWTRDYLTEKGDEHPRRSAEWLLCAATGLSRVELYTNFDRPLDAEELKIMHEGVVRRGHGEPLQYVTGEMPFRHIVLKCAPGVLIPRPETEVLVDEVLAYIDKLQKGEGSSQAKQDKDRSGETSEVRVLEVGTGTGCIALSLAGERDHVSVVATDISPDAIALATRNRDALELTDRVHIVECDLTSGVPEAQQNAFDVLVSNPPYIPTPVLATLPREVGSFEPALALDGGADGLAVFRRLVEAGTHALKPGGLLACELYEDSLVEASELPSLRASYENIRIVRDLTGRNRHLLATLRADAVHVVRPREVQASSESFSSEAEVEAEAEVEVEGEIPTKLSCAVRFDWEHPQAEVVERAVSVLSCGGVAILPTDTVVGIAQSVDANPRGPRRLFEIKRRDPNKAIAWLVGGTDALFDYGSDVPAWAARLARKFWPGGLTLVVSASLAVPEVFRGQGSTIALRMPAAPVVLDIVRELGCALATTSANTSGMPSPASYAQLEARVRDAADVVLDDGLTHSVTASTVVVCTGTEPVVAREGTIPTSEILRVAGGA